jgi:hypothetical protein
MQKFWKYANGVIVKHAGIKLCLLLLFMGFVACSPQRRLNRLVRKHPELISKDTVRIIDTIRIPSIQLDTTIETKPVDTVYLEKERLQLQIIRHYDTLKIHSLVKPEKIIIKKEIPVEKIVVKKVPNQLNKYLFLSLLFLLFLFILTFRR